MCLFSLPIAFKSENMSAPNPPVVGPHNRPHNSFRHRNRNRFVLGRFSSVNVVYVCNVDSRPCFKCTKLRCRVKECTTIVIHHESR